MAREAGTYPATGEPWTDEDRLALASEGVAFRRGIAAARRAVERDTPLAVGSLAAIDRLIEAAGPPPADTGIKEDEWLPPSLLRR